MMMSGNIRSGYVQFFKSNSNKVWGGIFGAEKTGVRLSFFPKTSLPLCSTLFNVNGGIPFVEQQRFAGHSKWHNIKHRKERQDMVKMAISNKICKAIASAVNEGGTGENNARLQLLISKAKSYNVPADRIKTALDKGSKDPEKLDDISYEVQAPSGVGLIVEVLTDNKNRTLQQLRYIFDRNCGSLAKIGSVMRNFKRKGVLTIDDVSKLEEIMEASLELSAESVEDSDNKIHILFDDIKMMMVAREELSNRGYGRGDVRIFMEPTHLIDLDADTEERISILINKLDDLDDVQEIYHNANLKSEDE